MKTALQPRSISAAHSLDLTPPPPGGSTSPCCWLPAGGRCSPRCRLCRTSSGCGEAPPLRPPETDLWFRIFQGRESRLDKAMAVSGYQQKMINLKRELFRCDVSDSVLTSRCSFSTSTLLILVFKGRRPQTRSQGPQLSQGLLITVTDLPKPHGAQALPEKPQEQPRP